MLELYRNGSKDKPPHVFGVAYNAYHCMLGEAANQSVVISGESGAGKSEATKLILQFLADVSQRATTAQHTDGCGHAHVALEQQILAANPILEAFGNAKTLRNNNSSRFGKLITIKFDAAGGIVGGSVVNYLLEKSRVTTQSKGERNYHIFYQLLAGVEDIYQEEPEFVKELTLQDPSMFAFMNQSGVVKVEGVSDEAEMEDVAKAMDILEYTSEQKKEVFRLVAGVLHMGNVKFHEKDDKAVVVNPDAIATAARLWQVNAADTEKFLTSKLIGSSKDLVLTPYTQQQATDARDAMVKRVYAALFQLMVDRINAVLSHGNANNYRNFIGVLDIFGFESFVINSFEQLCINYCNEKLQFHFNEHIFTMEQSVYAEEGVTICSSSFVDNQPTLDLFEQRADGLYSMLDEEIAMPKGSDDSFLAKILSRHGDARAGKLHPSFVKPKVSQTTRKQFGVAHYAGTVFYDVTNFLDKNKDQLNIDIMGVLKASGSQTIKEMFAPFEDRAAAAAAMATRGRAGGGKPKTLGAQFKMQLKELVDTLNKTTPHFIRCLKPNDEKKGGVFTAQRMEDQLKYAGLLEVCRIRKLGFPKRLSFDEFYKRYRPCDLGNSAADCTALAKVLEHEGALKTGEWALGHTKVFMRSTQQVELEMLREKAFTARAVIVQKRMRLCLARMRFRFYTRLVTDLRAAMVAREKEALRTAVEAAFELPYSSTNKTVREAKLLLVRLVDEARIDALMTKAVVAHDLAALTSALSQASGAVPPYESPLAAEVAALVTKIEGENAIKARLVTAIKDRDYDRLGTCLEEAVAASLTCTETKQAETLRTRIAQEMVLLEELAAAVAARELPRLGAALNACEDASLSAHAAVSAAQAVRAELEAEKAAAERAAREKAEREAANEVERARIAEEARVAAEAETARTKAEDEARREKVRAAREEAEVALKAAAEAKDVDALGRAIEHAIEIGLEGACVEEATAVQETLAAEAEKARRVESELEMLMSKEQVGIEEADLDALNELTKGQVDTGDGGFMSSAMQRLATYSRQAQTNLALKASLASNAGATMLSGLMDAIGNAEDQGLDNPYMVEAREKLQALREQAEKAVGGRSSKAEEAWPEQFRQSLSMLTPMTSVEDVETVRRKRTEMASNLRFSYKNYPKVRPVDNYARAAIFNKAAVKESYWVFATDDIPKSLTMMKYTGHNSHASQAFKNIVGYMGDKIVQYPAMLARDLLQRGFDFPELRPEIYLQIIKQLNGNPRGESIAKGWQLMCMCVSTFPPGPGFENYLMHYIMDRRAKSKGAVGEYAKYCLRSLDSILAAGDNAGFVPSVVEIESYRDRPPILASFELVDGLVVAEDVPITPDLNCGRILEMCSGWLELHDPRTTRLGVFVYDLGPTSRAKEDPAPHTRLPRTPRPLRNEDFLGDVVVQRARQHRKYKFVVKKKLFVPSEDADASADANYERLVFLQAEHDMLYDGTLTVRTEEAAVDFGAVSMVLAFEAETPTDCAGLVEAGVADFIAPAFRDARTPEEWAALMSPVVNDLKAISGDVAGLQSEFLSRTRGPMCAHYGTHWFFVLKGAVETEGSGDVTPNRTLLEGLPAELLIGFDYDGMHVCNTARESLVVFGFEDFGRWGGSSSQFSIVLTDHSGAEECVIELIVNTVQAQDISGIILDYVNLKMEEA